MGLIAQAKADIEAITSNTDEFGVAMTLTAPAAVGGNVLAIVGLHTKHHIGIDTEGNYVNTKNANATFSEKFLTDASYPVRNSNGEVVLTGHKVSVKDSTGSVKEYVIREWFPDETVGLIRCILGDFE